jgi:glucosamine--fructose-6-phosphate aminotransferase (isomerizing)
MSDHMTQMRKEILEIPAAVDRLLVEGAIDMRNAGKSLRDLDPVFMVSVARGSSDHVATYFKYASELLLGIPVASVGPSIGSIYAKEMRLDKSVCISVSQSGKSPDIVEMTKMARQQGALTVAMTNDIISPLAKQADHILNISAGPEISVAATKTFVTSAVSAIWLLAEWSGDRELQTAIYDLPSVLEDAIQTDWAPVQLACQSSPSIFCLGRGPAFAIANEAALKFKETCQIHAEAYSSAEVLHGPVSIVDRGFPVLGFASDDQAEPALVGVADQLADKGAHVFATSNKTKTAHSLPTIRTGHSLTDPIALIASFYSMVENVATGLGINPDAPRHLNKITETV